MEQFGKYTLIRKIGAGGMAEVFLARTAVAQGLAKILVIKKIHGAYARSRQFVHMFVDEAKIALGLNHPNIVQVFDFGVVGDTYFLAMEHVEGLDVLRLLQDCAHERRRIPYGLAAYMWTRDLSRAMRVSEALEYGIVGINDGLPTAMAPQAPFGGMKDSGIGREGGPWGLDEYLEVKLVSIGLG